MDAASDEESGANRTLVGAIFGAECSTGMAVTAGFVGVGLMPALAILSVGAIAGMALVSLIDGNQNNDYDDSCCYCSS